MNLSKHVKPLAIMVVVMLLLDIIYLYLIGGPVFAPMIKNIQRGTTMTLLYAPAVLVYIVMLIGLYHFVVKNRRPIWEAVLLGLLVYLVYDLTNKATLSGYTWTAVVLDGLWGGVLFGVTTAVTYYIMDNIN